jgi:hypothetical protein
MSAVGGNQRHSFDPRTPEGGGAAARRPMADTRPPGLVGGRAGCGLWDPRSRRVIGGFLQMHIPGFFRPRPSSQAGESRGGLQTAGLCVACGCAFGCRRRMRCRADRAADGAHFGGQDSRGLRIWPVRNLQGEKGLRHVEMTHNGGILDHEIDDGFILACCSKPLSALEIEAC